MRFRAKFGFWTTISVFAMACPDVHRGVPMQSDDGPAAFSYACALQMEQSVSVAPHNVVLTYPRADRISLPIPLGVFVPPLDGLEVKPLSFWGYLLVRFL